MHITRPPQPCRQSARTSGDAAAGLWAHPNGRRRERASQPRCATHQPPGRPALLPGPSARGCSPSADRAAALAHVWDGGKSALAQRLAASTSGGTSCLVASTVSEPVRPHRKSSSEAWRAGGRGRCEHEWRGGCLQCISGDGVAALPALSSPATRLAVADEVGHLGGAAAGWGKTMSLQGLGVPTPCNVCACARSAGQCARVRARERACVRRRPPPTSASSSRSARSGCRPGRRTPQLAPAWCDIQVRGGGAGCVWAWPLGRGWQGGACAAAPTLRKLQGPPPPTHPP